MIRKVRFLHITKRGSQVSCLSKDLARQWLQKLNPNMFPEKYFTIRYDRSSGPGGQNVNKLNSKCTLRLYNFSKTPWIPIEVKTQLINKRFRYYFKTNDCVVVQSDETRSRTKNKRICIEKLIKEITNICHFSNETINQHVIEKWKRIKQASNNERLRSKEYHSDKKRNRNYKTFI